MTIPQSQRTPLARLVLFMICVSIAGSLAAGLHYYAVDLPLQNAVKAPENSYRPYTDCEDQCLQTETDCSNTCGDDVNRCRSCLKDFWPCYHACHT